MRPVPTLVRKLLSATEWIESRLRRFDDSRAVGPVDAPGRPLAAPETADSDSLSWDRHLTRALRDTVPESIYFKDAEGQFLSINQAMARRLGLSTPQQAVGKTDRDFFPAESARSSALEEQEIIRTGQPILDDEEEEVWPDHSTSWSSITKLPLRDAAGQIVGTFGITRDITASKQAEAALMESERRYRAVCELISDYAYSFRVMPDGSFEDEWVTAASFIRLTGYHWNELDEQGAFALFDPAEKDNLPQEQELLRQGQTVGRDYQIITRDGEARWLHILRRPEWDEARERIVRFYGVAQDVTERKRAEAAEREQRVLAEAMRDIAAALISTTDVRTVMTRVLETVGRVVPHDYATIMLIEGDYARVAHAHGWPEEDEFIARSVRMPLAAANLHTMIVQREPLLISDVPRYPDWVEVEWKARKPTGSYVGAPIQVHGQVIGFLNLDSNTPGFFTTRHADRLGIFADQAAIAIENAQLYDELQQHAHQLERRVAERTVALQRAKDHVEAILDNNSDAIIVAWRDSTVSQVNPAFGQLFSYPLGDALDESLLTLLPSTQTDALRDALEAVRSTRQSARLEMSIQRKDGSQFDADVVLSPILEHDPLTAALSMSGVVCSVRDITERKQAEMAAQQALKAEMELNELKSRFISMASHEFRTPLASILSSSELLIRYRERMDVTQLDEKLRTIVAQVQYLTSVIEDVLDMSRMESAWAEFKPVSTDLDGLCRGIIDEFANRPEITHQIIFTSTPPPRLMLDDRLMHRIITNLLTNAIKYSPSDTPIFVSLDTTADDMVLRVRDQGIGIPLADQKHLFQPFHRATNVGTIAGTGLGLSIIKRAVELHDGTIEVKSEVGIGTTFTISIPLRPHRQQPGTLNQWARTSHG